MTGVERISAERERQIAGEGWTPEHDDEHFMGEMIGAAISYAGHALEVVTDAEISGADLIDAWPSDWDQKWWKPSPDAIPNLVKAGALLAAEIDRLQRASPMGINERVARESRKIFTNAQKAALSVLLCLFALTASAQSTKSYDVTRSNQNPHETTLTAASVAAMPMAPQLIPCMGDARGCEAQPLVDEAVPIAGRTRAVMALASEANVVRGVDPDSNPTGAAIWETPQLCVPVRTDSTVDMWGINFYIGMMGTGDADPVLHRLYQVATCSKDGSGRPASIEQRMFVLSMVDGSVLASVPITGSSNGNVYTAAPRKQRAGILPWTVGGTRFKMVLSSTFSENGALATGFLSAFDTYDNTFKAIASLGAGGWMSSQAPSMDPATGLIYLALGNGPYAPPTKFGEAVLQIRFTPPTATTQASFAVLHSWALFSDDIRTCRKVYPANKVAGVSAPSGVPGGSMPMVAACDASWGDQDFGLFGKLLPDVGKYMAGGKDGVVALVDTKSFPDTKPADFLKPVANCAKVGLYEPGWNLGISPCPLTAAALNTFGPDNKTRHATGGRTVTWPSNVLGGFTVSGTASKRSMQCFDWSQSQTAWVAESAGITNY